MHWLEWPVVSIRLLVGDHHLPLGEDFLLLMDKPEANIPRCDAVLRLNLGTVEEDWQVHLPNGLTASTKLVKIAPDSTA
jgi:hypothetical protein